MEQSSSNGFPWRFTPAALPSPYSLDARPLQVVRSFKLRQMGQYLRVWHEAARSFARLRAISGLAASRHEAHTAHQVCMGWLVGWLGLIDSRSCLTHRLRDCLPSPCGVL